MRQLIATGGKAGAGKDYVLGKLAAYEAGQNERFLITGFGDLVRRELAFMGYPDPMRDLQQSHGQIRRQQDPDYWLKKVVEFADVAVNRYDVVGFTGVRFENELDYLKENDFYVGLVEAPEGVRRHRLLKRDGRVWTDAELNHATETALDTIPREKWDFIWDNS